MSDLRHLAAYGRWRRRLPPLRRGLKRGFTFHDHRPGASLDDRRSLLVAASPEDALADTHWLRADVDHHLVTRAQEEGVDYFDRTEVTAVRIEDSGVGLSLDGVTAPAELRAAFLVDAGGPAGIAHSLLGVPRGPALDTRSSLVYGHFRNVSPAPAASEADSPYPAGWAAVHHLVDGGWVYELRFDDGRVSAGVLLSDDTADEAPARTWAPETWARVLSGQPALARAFGEAEPLAPLAGIARVQHRLARAVGTRWAALPHPFGFVDPLFSTLRAVERLAATLGAPDTDVADLAEALGRYDRLLNHELEQVDRLIAGAYAAMRHFELFAAYSLTYFAAVSWAELRERLIRPAEAHWEGFLGPDDSERAGLFAEARRALPAAEDVSRDAIESYWRWIARRVRPFDLLGLDRHGPRLAVPVDLEVLVERADRLGLDREGMRRRLPLLRGDAEGAALDTR